MTRCAVCYRPIEPPGEHLCLNCRIWTDQDDDDLDAYTNTFEGHLIATIPAIRNFGRVLREQMRVALDRVIADRIARRHQ